MKEYCTFAKTPILLEPHHQMQFCVISRTLSGVSYPPLEMKLVYSTAPANWVRPPPNECPGYDDKQFDDEVLVMLEL